jgi:uncharacterized protein (DUF1800 family)
VSDAVGLLLRRAGFGPTASALTAARAAGYNATLDALMAPSTPDAGAQATPVPKLGLDPYASMPTPTDAQRATADAQRRAQTDVITRWWLDRMVLADHQAFEKLVFFWHGHWATSVEKVMSPQLMLRQQLGFRSTTDFMALARIMVVDPALVYFLDGHTNTAQAPNENLGRELMELFTLGIGHYTEKDVKEAGRALTGYWVNLGIEGSVLDPAKADKGVKTILGVSGNFDAKGLVNLLLNNPACPPFVAARLWYRYGSSTTPLSPALQKKMVAAFPSVPQMQRAMFADDQFLASAGTLAKQPVEWLVGAMRQLGLRPGKLSDGDYRTLIAGLQNLGQLPYSPPSVGGWPAGVSWLTPSSARLRLGVAYKLADLAHAPVMAPDQLAATLAIDAWTDRTYAALRDLTDPRLRLAVALSSPEYLVT